MCVCVCVCVRVRERGRMVSPSHMHVEAASPTWMLIIFLIGFLDLVTSAWDSRTASLFSSFSAVFWLCLCRHFSFHSLSNSRDWSQPGGSMAFDSQPSSTFIIIHLHILTLFVLIHPAFWSSYALLIRLRRVLHRHQLKLCNQESWGGQTLKPCAV